MASPTQWTGVQVNPGSWWWTGKPGVLQSMGLQRVGHNWVTELNWTEGCKESDMTQLLSTHTHNIQITYLRGKIHRRWPGILWGRSFWTSLILLHLLASRENTTSSKLRMVAMRSLDNHHLEFELLWQVFLYLWYKDLSGCYKDEPPVRILQAEIWGRRIQIAAEMFSFVLIFMACCTAIHMFLCMSNIITSFQKDRQHNEWIVKHAHKNSRVRLEVSVLCFWFTVYTLFCIFTSFASFLLKISV